MELHDDKKRCCGVCGNKIYKKPPRKRLKVRRFTKIFYVKGMKCKNCVNRVAEAVNAVDGVVFYSGNCKSGQVYLDYERIVLDEEVFAAVEAIGCRIGADNVWDKEASALETNVTKQEEITEIHEQNHPLIIQMKQVIEEFLPTYSQFFMDNVSEEVVGEYTTQGFLNGIKVSKKRMDALGIKRNLKIETSKHKPFSVWAVDDGHTTRSESFEDIIVTRTYYKNNQAIYSEKSSAFCEINLMKHNVDGGKACCPQCGHVGQVSKFLEGCEYCGTSFSIKDFEPKISTWTMQDKRYITIVSRWLKLLPGILIFVGILMLSHIFAWVKACFFAVGCGYLGSGAIMMYQLAKDKVTIRDNDVIKDVVPDFPVEVFAQDLEYKLKHLYLSQNMKEVASYVVCDIAEFWEKKPNVVDCMTVIDFKKITDCKSHYVIETEIAIKLYLYENNHIKTKWDFLDLTLTGNKDLCETKGQKILEPIICKKCGSSINIYEDIVCNYCGSDYDYSNYGWQITRLTKRKGRNNEKF